MRENDNIIYSCLSRHDRWKYLINYILYPYLSIYISMYTQIYIMYINLYPTNGFETKGTSHDVIIFFSGPSDVSM